MSEELKCYLEELRKAKGLTHKQLAEISNVPEGTVSRYLSTPPKDPSYVTVVALVTALGGSIDCLCGLKSDTSNEVRASHKKCTLCEMSEQAISTSRDAYTHAYNEIQKQHEIELARVKQYLRVKDRWLIAMFAYCIILTMIVVFKQA